MAQENTSADLQDLSGRNQAKPEKIANGVEKPSDKAHAEQSKSPVNKSDRNEDNEAVDVDSETGA